MRHQLSCEKKKKIKILCDEYSSRSMILNENNGKNLISSVAQNLSKALINHQLLIDLVTVFDAILTSRQTCKKYSVVWESNVE